MGENNFFFKEKKKSLTYSYSTDRLIHNWPKASKFSCFPNNKIKNDHRSATPADAERTMDLEMASVEATRVSARVGGRLRLYLLRTWKLGSQTETLRLHMDDVVP